MSNAAIIGSVFFVLYFVLLTLFLGFLIFLLILIPLSKAVPAPVRFVLWNIFAASVLVVLGMEMLSLHVAVTFFGHPRSDVVCRVIFTVLTSGSAARLVLMPLFAAVVAMVIRWGVVQLKMCPTVLSVLVVWAVCILPNLALFSPQLVTFDDLAFDRCALLHTGAPTIAYAVLFLTIYGLASIAVTVAVTVAAFAYVKRNTLEQDRRLQRSMIKFGALLLVGNGLSLLGVLFPTLTSAFLPQGDSFNTLHVAFNYIEVISISLSVIPPPVVLLVIFEPVRANLKAVLCFSCAAYHRRLGGKPRGDSGPDTSERNS